MSRNNLGAYNIEDLRQMAKRKLPRGIFEFVDGGAEDGIAVQNNRDAYTSLKIKNRVLIDVSKRLTGHFGRDLQWVVVFHRGVAGIVIEVFGVLPAVQSDSLLQQVFMDVQQPATREDLVEFVFLQLIHAGAAGYDHGLDVEIVQGMRDAVEQDAVGCGNGLPFVCAVSWRKTYLRPSCASTLK